MARVMEIKTPLGDGALLFYSMAASEALGRLFEYELTLLSNKSDIKPEDLLGKNVTVKLQLPDGSDRFFDAYVTRFGLTGGLGRYFRYQLTGRPWAWLMTRTADCRIFQNKSVPDIVKDIFNKYPSAKFENKLTGEHRPWEYCVQYRETDFNFVSRLLEQEGIYYFFKHEDGKHTMVLADSNDAHEAVSGFEQYTFLPQAVDTPRLKDEVVEEWLSVKQLQPGAYVYRDYDFERPSVNLEATFKDARKHAEAKGEIFDFPGEYIVKAEGEHFVQTRLEELLAQFDVCEGSGTTRSMCTGSLFKLAKHPRADQNREYLVTSAQYRLQFEGYEGLDDTGGDYRCSFTAMPSAVPFRPARGTPKPIVQGPQTGVVVGPSGDEIYTDKYGRVKVKFHWDRHGKKDENASCWMRVSYPWAGSNWGAIHIPRIGQEVIVDFLEGDPDCPIVTGCVYNAEQMPPWELPGNKTQSGILTRSSAKGASANANAIRFEDKKGSEQLWIHAEKNQDIEVENDETHWVGHDRKKTIDNDETTRVKHDRTETVDNNETITIHGQRTETVDKDETITIHQNRTETVDQNENITVHGARTEKVDKDESITIGGARTESVTKDESITISGGRTENVAKDESITISGGRTENVAKDESITISGGRTENVAKDESITISGGRTETVAKNESITINGGRTETVAKDESVTISGGRTVSISKDDSLSVGKNLTITAGDSVSITTGSASITMKKDGTITIKGKDIQIEGSGKINAKASSDIVMKGSKILQN